MQTIGFNLSQILSIPYPTTSLALFPILILTEASCRTMKREGLRLGTKSRNTTKGDPSREPQVDKIYLGET
jgi:hypothetical protein